MAETDFQTNLLRMIAAELWFSLRLQVARDLYGKGYLSLSPTEKLSVDQIVFGTIAADYQTLTANLLQPQTSGLPMGFQAPSPQPSPPAAPPAPQPTSSPPKSA